MVFTTPLKSDSIKIMLLGSGELGKEVAIEAQRLGLEVVAVDRYPNAPAHLVANRAYVIDMLDFDELIDVIRREKPNFILPEVEAINIEALFEAEKEGFRVIPNAEAVNKTMNRKNIRKFAAEDLGVKTSKYFFVKDLKGLEDAAKNLGFPVVIKPVMSSSGHGQSIARDFNDLKRSLEIAKEARGDSSELIVEEFIDFDYEITLLTIKNDYEVKFCPPIGHIQKDGDYIFSWQPANMSKEALKRAEEIAKKVVEGLGGRGIFGVEFFIKGDEVYFSELSPRPHDTGMVTMITQSQSEFALHIRAVLNLPLDFEFFKAGASGAYKAKRESKNPKIKVAEDAFSKSTFVRIFGKPNSHKGRRMAVALALGENIEEALEKAKNIVSKMDD
ncbi:MAG: formate-dependent phosphoribosylglycinamide formyltransferase [Epsilonproteobacteria bacterium]|nr:formate-dependent phosphoribosylglycinamide formyltransferase [Campylobacterota bacterium]